ncbi:MAG: NAD dependent epimerase/dehydratase family enzyme, partial [Myxococcota bacterium]
ALFTEALSGPVNAVAPGAVTNGDFGRGLGRVLRRPAVAPLPGGVVKLVMGQMGEELLLFSARASSEKLVGSGYGFLTPELPEALCAELGR